MLLQCINVISHEGKFVASKMIKIVPCIDASFMQVIKNYPATLRLQNLVGKSKNVQAVTIFPFEEPS